MPDYLLQDYTATTPHDYLSLIAPLTEGEHIVEAVQATSEECALLRILPHDPCLAYSPPHLVDDAYCLTRSPAVPRRALPSVGPFQLVILLASAKRDC